MPYKSEKINISGTKHDRRVKLTDEDKKEVVRIRSNTDMSYNDIAKAFGVSKRLIIFTCKPETLAACIKKRDERGGSAQYYDKAKNTASIREHRAYKQKLYKLGKIDLHQKAQQNEQDQNTENR